MVPGIGRKEDMTVKLTKIAGAVEGSSTLEKWKPFLIRPEFLTVQSPVWKSTVVYQRKVTHDCPGRASDMEGHQEQHVCGCWFCSKDI